MAKATCVPSTPPTNMSAIDHPMMFPPRDLPRRHFLAVAGVASAVSAGTLAAAAAAIVTMPRSSRPDPAFALVADKRATDIAHCEAIDAQEAAEEHGIRPDADTNQ